MLQLKVNGEWVDLGANPVITLDEESPVFEKTSIPGGYSFPFTLPATSRNRRIFGFPERIEKRAAMAVSLDFELYHSGKLRLSGTITVSEADTEYRANLVVSSGDFASKIGEHKLSDVDLGGERSWAWIDEYTYPESDFGLFPVYNPKFMDETEFVNTWIGNNYRLNSYQDGDWFKNTATTMAVSPFPFLGYVLKRIFSTYGFSIRMNIFETDPDLASLVIYSTRDIAQVVKTTSQKEITFYDALGRQITKTITVTEISRVLDKFDLADSMPEMTIKSFIKSLRNLFNVAFVFDKYNRVDIISRQDLVLSTNIIDITKKVSGDPKVIAITPPSGYQLKWAHDENDTLFSEKVKDITQHLDNLKDSVADYDELMAIDPDLNEIRYVEEWDLYMQYAVEIDEEDNATYEWKIFSHGFQDYFSGEMEEQFSSDLSTLMMGIREVYSGGPATKLPWAEQKSNAVIRPEKIPFTARLLFYRGMIYQGDDNLYPMGSSDNISFYGNKIAGANLTMKWEGEYGRYNQLWKNYLTWWMTRRQVNYKITDPSTLEFNRKYAIDGKHYLLKKRTVTFTLRSVAVGECEFYLV